MTPDHDRAKPVDFVKHRAIGEKILAALRVNPLSFGAYIANERIGKEECLDAIAPVILAALDAVRREEREACEKGL